MTRFLLALSLAFAATGCLVADDEAPVDAAEFGGADCGCVSDTPIDSPNPCDACGAGTICVQLLGGTCSTISVTCQPVVTGCDQPLCSTECNEAYCDPGGVSTCQAAGCGAEDIVGALHCYGV